MSLLRLTGVEARRGAAVVLASADLEVARGDDLEVRPGEGRIFNHSSGREFACERIPDELMDIVAGGGLMPWLERKLAAERGT